MDQSTLCLIHGHGVDASIWDSVYADLAVNRPVIRPDLSRRTTDETIDQYADALAKHVRAEVSRGGRVVLVGHSMGGYIALALAERHPDLVNGLVLYHSTAYPDDETKREQRTKAIATLTTEGTPGFIAELMPKLVAPSFQPEEIQKLIERYRDLPADALIAGVKAIAGRPDRTHVLRDASFPVLLVLGEEDQVIPVEKARSMADLSDRLTVRTLPGVGHLSMVEQPETSVRILQEFTALM